MIHKVGNRILYDFVGNNSNLEFSLLKIVSATSFLVLFRLAGIIRSGGVVNKNARIEELKRTMRVNRR